MTTLAVMIGVYAKNRNMHYHKSKGVGDGVKSS
jgi:hypothetical protein